jgi:hypothetical protein
VGVAPLAATDGGPRRPADQEALRADVTDDEAADILWMRCGFEAFDARPDEGRAAP